MKKLKKVIFLSTVVVLLTGCSSKVSKDNTITYEDYTIAFEKAEVNETTKALTKKFIITGKDKTITDIEQFSNQLYAGYSSQNSVEVKKNSCEVTTIGLYEPNESYKDTFELGYVRPSLETEKIGSCEPKDTTILKDVQFESEGAYGKAVVAISPISASVIFDQLPEEKEDVLLVLIEMNDGKIYSLISHPMVNRGSSIELPDEISNTFLSMPGENGIITEKGYYIIFSEKFDIDQIKNCQVIYSSEYLQ